MGSIAFGSLLRNSDFAGRAIGPTTRGAVMVLKSAWRLAFMAGLLLFTNSPISAATPADGCDVALARALAAKDDTGTTLADAAAICDAAGDKGRDAAGLIWLRRAELADRAGLIDPALAAYAAGIQRLTVSAATAERLVAAQSAYSGLLRYVGEDERSLDASRMAYELAQRFPGKGRVAAHEAALAYASALLDRYRLTQAEAVMQGELRAAQRDPGSLASAESAYLTSRILFNMEQIESAGAMIAKARRIVDRLPPKTNPELAADIVLEQARQAFETSANDRALALLDTAIPRYAALGPAGTVGLGIARQARASVQFVMGDFAAAEAQARATLEPMRTALPPQARPRQNSEAIYALVRSHDPARAAEAFADLRPSYAAARDMLLAPDRSLRERADLAFIARTNFARFAAVALRAGQTEAAFEAVQYLSWSDVAQSAQAAARRTLLADPAAARDLAKAESLADQIEALRARRNFAAGRDPALATELGKEIELATVAYRQAYAQLGTLPSGTGQQGLPTIRKIADVQARLAPGRAVLALIPTDNRLLALAIRNNRIVWDQSALSIPAMKRNVARLRASLARGEPRQRFDRAAALTLGNAIFSPAVAAALANCEEIEVIGAGALLSVPFGVLLQGQVSPATLERLPLRQLPYLIRRHAFAFRPLPQGLTGPAPTAQGGFLGVGAPQLGTMKGDLRGIAPGRLDVSALPALPGAKRELQELAARIAPQGSLILTGVDATEARLKSANLADFRILAFATHGLMAGEFDGLVEPALVLTPPAGPSQAAGDDGLLTASEIAQLRFNADWAILSACNSGAEREPGSSTYSGLARAFMQAGVANLLVSLWPVRDDVARRISLTTIDAHAAGSSRAGALRAATLALIDDATVPDGDNPAVWGPFSLVER